jgi:hypothetical protein
MRELPQWVLAGADKVPLALDQFGQLKAVSATRPSEWMTFERAVSAAWLHKDKVTTHTTPEGQVISRTGLDLGFVLHEADPFTCIDLDVKDAETHPGKPEVWTTADDFQRFVSIINTMDSYTERSRSGKGIHVWVRGNIGRGFRRGGVEVYSQERYMICTGDVYIDKPVGDRETMLGNMIAQMRPINRGNDYKLVEHPADVDDWYVFQTAATAANSEKFWELWRGNWEGLGFPSQSEADLALMSMFTFYSDSNAQCRALFRASALGRREKTTKNDYHVDKLLKLIRQRQDNENNVELNAMLQHAEMVASLVSQAQGGGKSTPTTSREVPQLTVPGTGDTPQTPVPSQSALAQLAPVQPAVLQAGETGLAWPPGFMGAVARYIYDNSFLQIKEVSIVAALGLMAGLCGKAWHIPKSGLNLYIILVARSAIGKEGMHSGIASLVTHCQEKFEFFSNFVDFNEHASGPALIKSCMAQPSSVNVSGEWGRRLKRMSKDDERDGPMVTLRTQMTNLYQKSGPQSIAGGLSYSNAESNVASVAGVAYSMIGESTPATFYEALTESMMEDGFLSRFLIIGYDGDRPRENPSMLEKPDDALRDALCAVATHAHTQIHSGSSCQVGRTEEAANIMKAFSDECHDNINGLEDESRRQMWNRAALKAFRVAALCAVGDHYLTPSINKGHIEWAIELVRQDIAMMSKKLEGGDIGVDDRARERKLMSVVRDYMVADKIPSAYKVNDQMHKERFIPRKYLFARLQAVTSFRTHPRGTNFALDETVKHCISNGFLKRVKADKIADMFNHHGEAFILVDMPDYISMRK